MASDELDKVELPALEQLQSLGWSYFEGAQLSPDESDERSSLKDVVLEKRLTIPKGFHVAPRRQVSEAPLSPRMECMLNNVRNVVSSSLRSSR